jgi:Concanavalin A-like lectin/glucanases superfamily/Chitobiase/beta-hexosaminidase C-terminal domain
MNCDLGHKKPNYLPRWMLRSPHLFFFACPVALLLVLLLATTAYATTPPNISPSYRVFSSGPQTVTITGTAGNSFFYTTDGTNPGLGSTPYSSPFPVSVTTTVKAVAYDGTTLSTITTSIVQIDPSTGSLPSSGLLCWYKADNGAIVSSGSVTAWKDVSGNGLDGTQGTSANQPTVDSTAINSLPALVFNGTTQYLALPTGFSNFTAGESLFVMAKPTTFFSTGARFIDMLTGPGFANSLPFYQPAVSTLAFSVYGNPDTNVTTVQSSTGLALGVYQLFEATHDGTATATLYNNGIPLAQNTAMFAIPNVSRTFNAIAEYGALGPYYFEGEIAEILLYNRHLSDSERGNVENYLLSRYWNASAAATPPIFSLPTSTLAAPNQIAISGPPGSSIMYSVDGTTPSLTYSGPIQINYTQTVKALSVVNGLSSSIATVTLTLDSAKFPVPSSADTRPLTINLQLPATAQ